MSFDVEGIVDNLFNKVLNEISKQWKEKTDKIIKAMEKQNKRLMKENGRLTDAFNLEREKYNQLVHEKNLEMTAMNKFTIELQSIIEKLKNKEVFNDETK